MESGLPEIGIELDQLVRRGEQQVIQQTLEAESAELLARYGNVNALAGTRV